MVCSHSTKCGVGVCIKFVNATESTIQTEQEEKLQQLEELIKRGSSVSDGDEINAEHFGWPKEMYSIMG